LQIASSFLKMPFESVDEDVEDVLGEFVNIVLGNIAVKLSSEDIIVDLTPPEIIDQADFEHSDYYCFDFTTTHGNLTLGLKL